MCHCSKKRSDSWTRAEMAPSISSPFFNKNLNTASPIYVPKNCRPVRLHVSHMLSAGPGQEGCSTDYEK